MPDKPAILSEAEVAEIADMFPHAEYQPTLSPGEVGPCEFCKGTIDDHKANCVVPHVHALRQTVRVLRTVNEQLHAVSSELAERLIKSADRNGELLVENGDLQSRLAQVEQERDRFSELADKRHDELSEARRQRDSLAANHEAYTREAVRHALENLDHKGE